MKIFTLEKSAFLLFLLLLISIFVMFIFHDIYIGTDEIRTTYVSKEIATQGEIYFKDTNNSVYNTNIFLKNAFLINSDKVIYPAGFTINSLILIPVLSIAPDPVTVFNIFSLICYILSFFIIYKIFCKLHIKKYRSMVGALIFSLTNFYLAMYVSYYPDFLLTLYCLTFIYMIICFQKSGARIYFYLSIMLSAFLLAYKITMYPIIFTFVPLYFIYLYKTKKANFKVLVSSASLFLILVLLFNLPQLITNKIGPTYNELSTSSDDSQPSSLSNAKPTKTSPLLRVEHLANVFYADFLVPKGDGIYLEEHFVKDFLFLSSNNIIFIFGFLFGTIYLYKDNKKVILFLVLLLFLTSFALWGNMNAYGGGGVYDLGDLRNTHVRYMLPIFVLFFIVGFYYLFRVISNKYILTCLFAYILIVGFISLNETYPFNDYSLINQNSFFYDYQVEKHNILNLNIPQNSIFVSTVFDDYDLSYYFANYADFKLLSNNPSQMIHTLDEFTQNNNVYVLYPIKDSRFNPIKQKDLNKLYSYMQSHYHSKVIFSDNYKKLISLSRK